MAQRGLPWLLGTASLVCRQCRPSSIIRIGARLQSRQFATSKARPSEAEVRAAPEINLEKLDDVPARIVPASPSYFTASPVFNDNLLLLQQLLKEHQGVPTLPDEHVPRVRWMTLSQYKSAAGEKIAAAQYAKVLRILQRLNKIHPDLRSSLVQKILVRFQRPGAAEVRKAQLGQIDEHGRSVGVGRRKESTARVYLVEGTGEVLVNGKSIVQVFPRLHDRESALWALKISQRMDKYNVFAKVEGGGVTGQAESVTLAVARALLVHEPALKPALRRGMLNC
jgi:small subunit ribosomal protein S9